MNQRFFCWFPIEFKFAPGNRLRSFFIQNPPTESSTTVPIQQIPHLTSRDSLVGATASLVQVSRRQIENIGRQNQQRDPHLLSLHWEEESRSVDTTQPTCRRPEGAFPDPAFFPIESKQLQNQAESSAADPSFRPKKHLGTISPDLLKLIRQCWDSDPLERPSFDSILSLLVDRGADFVKFRKSETKDDSVGDDDETTVIRRQLIRLLEIRSRLEEVEKEEDSASFEEEEYRDGEEYSEEEEYGEGESSDSN